MSEHNNEMRFALFKNDKGDNDKRPDYRGTIQIGGVEYDLSAWIKTAKSGSKFMSGQVSAKKANAAVAQAGFAAARAEVTTATETDDVPF